MKLIDIIKKFKQIEKRQPFWWGDLVLHVQEVSDKEFTRQAIRNVLLSEYYELKYQRFANELYTPIGHSITELLMSFAKGKSSIGLWGISLLASRGMTTQMPIKISLLMSGEFDDYVIKIVDLMSEKVFITHIEEYYEIEKLQESKLIEYSNWKNIKKIYSVKQVCMIRNEILKSDKVQWSTKNIFENTVEYLTNIEQEIMNGK